MSKERVTFQTPTETSLWLSVFGFRAREWTTEESAAEADGAVLALRERTPVDVNQTKHLVDALAAERASLIAAGVEIHTVNGLEQRLSQIMGIAFSSVNGQAESS